MSIFEKLVTFSPAFATSSPAPRVSSKYVHISSEKITNLIESKGWVLDTSARAIFKSSDPYGKHGAQFLHPDLNFEIRTKDKIRPIIKFVTSHDGLNSFRMYAGYYREICSNGLAIPITVGDVENTHLRLRHIYLSPQGLYDMLEKVTESLSVHVHTLSEFVEYELVEEQIHNYATTAIRRRMQIVSGMTPSDFDWNVKVPMNVVEGLVAAQFEQDKGRTAWEIYNNVQGALLERGFKVHDPILDRITKVKPLKSFARTSKLNVQLFTDMRELVTAGN